MQNTVMRGLVVAAITVLASCQADQSVLLNTLQRAPRVKRVIGGTDIIKGQWPYLAHLQGKVPKGWWFWGGYTYYYCGLSVINSQWVMTAAHCLRPKGANENAKQPKYWHVKVGEVEAKHSVWDKVKHYFGKVTSQRDLLLWYLHTTKIVVHPDYNPSKLWENDIALLKLEDNLPIGIDPDISSVTLPAQGDTTWPAPGEDCYMKGWGCTRNGGPITQIARMTRLPVCDANTATSIYGSGVAGKRICAGGMLQDKGICQGDSGGPLVCKKGDTWVQAGIASFTSASRPGQVPGIFTAVTHYVDWINDVVNNN